MTDPEIMNSSPAVDDAIDPHHAMSNQNMQLVVERAQNQLRQFTLQRQQIDQRIAIIKRTIQGLRLLYGSELQRRPEDGVPARRRRGITKACRVVLNRADTSLSAREVYAILQSQFPDLFRQPGDFYASLVTILNRLVKHGEADTCIRNGSRLWQKHQSADHRSVGLSSA